LQADFEGALERREFQVSYQPIVALASNEIVGLEALVRWQHPVLGTIPPTEFIPLAEKTGFIVPLGSWVLREACRQMTTWQENLVLSPDVWVSVNVSGLQLREPDFVEEVGSILRDTSLSAHRLVLELTEGVAMENPGAAKTLLMQLRMMGARVSIDDFGTGYSSLASLRQLPVDTLKVDRSFLRGIESSKEIVDMFRAITAMAEQLSLQVVAEGIENEAQLTLVRTLPCTYGQGMHFAAPLDPDRAARVLATGLAASRPPAATDEPAALASADPPAPPARHWAASPTARVLYVAAAAVVLLVSVGLPARGDRDLARETETRDLMHQPVAPPASDVAGGASTAPPISSGAGRTTPDPSASSDTRPSRVSSNTAPVIRSVTLPVEHQHRLGSCQGVLVASRDGVAFVPDERSNDTDDAFSLRHGEFLHELEEDDLTIRSNTRTYRFKSAATVGERGRADLQRLAAALRRVR
jgi:EAL domain-containing protein (putative c-di-GMP-specific phosphodiesterase class I)